ncbi:MAG: DcaP family trimeric outer membrane transporter [Candidatus Eiseniibacteriota bacterium]
MPDLRAWIAGLHLAVSLGFVSPASRAAADTSYDRPATKDDASRPAHPGTADSVAAASPAPGGTVHLGGAGKLQIGGFVKVDVIHDFDAIGNANEFKVNSIPVAGTPGADQGPRTTIQARESRIHLDYRTGGDLRVFIEGDFFGDNNTFRLRHAYGEAGHLLAGQTWSTFMDLSVRPLTVDFEGADGEVYIRQPLVRWTQSVAAHWLGELAVENPSPEFAVPSTLTGSARGAWPDVVAAIRYERARGHVRVAGVVREIRFDGEGGSPDQTDTGWGVNTTLGLKTFGPDELLAQFATGEGLGHYVEGLNGTNSDAAFDGAGTLTALGVQSFALGYIRHWNASLRSGVAYSTARVDTDPAQGGQALERIQDARANLLAKRGHLEVGAEVLWGRREDADGARGEAWRTVLAFIYHID